MSAIAIKYKKNIVKLVDLMASVLAFLVDALTVAMDSKVVAVAEDSGTGTVNKL